MSVHVFVALLALCSLTSAADPDCEELVQPLEDPSQAAGKWIFHVGASEGEEAVNEMKGVSSSWIEVFPVNESLSLLWADKILGTCYTGNLSLTLSDNTFSGKYLFNGTQHHHSWKYMKTCPDCVFWSGTTESLKEGGKMTKSKNLFLFTKTGKLDDEHLEVFKKQAACLNFAPEFHFGDTDVCPYENEASTDAPVKEE